MGERPIVPDRSKCTEESAAVPTKNPSCFSVPKKTLAGWREGRWVKLY